MIRIRAPRPTRSASSRRAALLAAALAATLTGCKTPPPPPTPVPPAPTASGYGDVPPETARAATPGGAAQRLRYGADVPGRWWTLFHSAALNALVEASLRANPDVDAAQAAVRVAREGFLAQRASAYPSAQGVANVSRQQQPGYLASPLGDSPTYLYVVNTAAVNVGYVPDVFGGLRYATAGAKAADALARAQLEAVDLTLTADVATAFIQAAGLRDQIALTRDLVAAQARLLRDLRERRRYGVATELDVAAQESALAQTQATLPPLERALAQTRHRLARLTGDGPDRAPRVEASLADLRLPEELPVSLPSRLIAQRPDVVAAEANLAAASAQVGVAYANRLPNFSITAQLASQALALTGLAQARSLFTTLTGQAALPLYDHGALAHRERAAVAAYDQAAAQYRGAALTGLQNVGDALIALDADARTLAAAARAEAAARRALALTGLQRRYGAVAIAAVLQAEQGERQTALSLAQARAARCDDVVALFAALGGGWWNRRDVAAPR